MKIYKTSDYNMDTSGKSIVTQDLQKLIDLTSMEEGKLIVEKGTYLVSSLFLKSNMEFHLEKEAIILGTTDESEYPVLPTRVAGIEMDWFVGIINCSNAHNVKITGEGVINGQGPYWWNKYWGKDRKGGMRKDYDAKGLRWIVDYDCFRVRNIVINNSHDITLKEFESSSSGFWNVHILYSKHVRIDNIKITNCGENSPSTDGIDIDSSNNILIENCKTSCNDDCICIKSGRDGNGFRVNRPCFNITVRNCEILNGGGVTIGSEVSGGIYNIKLENIKFKGTDCGFRIKSSEARKGYIKNVTVKNLEMENVKYPFNFSLNWNPSYSICEMPEDYKDEIPKHWNTLLEKAPENTPNTKVENIEIKNVKSYNSKDYKGTSRAFQIEGFKDTPISNITFENVEISAKEYGVMSHVENINFVNTKISAYGANNSANDIYDHR